jgi:hypothetical protein
MPTPAEHFVLDDFTLGSAALTVAHRATLQRIVDALRDRPLPSGGVLNVLGNGDAVGSHMTNLSLGERRAAAVRAAIVDQAPLVAAQVQTMSLGELMPLGGSRANDGRNRRVDVRIDRAADPSARTGMAIVRRGGGSYTSRPKDSLWRIAELTYGHGMYWPRIAAANPGRVQAGNVIHPGVTLSLPEIWVPILDVLLALGRNPAALRDFARSLPDRDYEALWTGLTPQQRQRHAIFLQSVELIRSSGMTLDELAAAQLTFLRTQATAAGQTVGEYLRGEADTRGYGGAEATRWNGLTSAQQRAWRERFNAVQRSLRTTAPPDIRDILHGAERRGGGIRFMPAEVERNRAFAYTQGDNTLYVGLSFVEAAERDLSIIYPNVSHELLGHNVYGSHEYGWAIMERVLALLPRAQRDLATSGSNSLYSAYGYMETEIFAELYEDRYDSPNNPTDRPFVGRLGRPADVPKQLQVIHNIFAPAVCAALVRGLARRVQIDDYITPGTKSSFRQAVTNEYGFNVP